VHTADQPRLIRGQELEIEFITPPEDTTRDAQKRDNNRLVGGVGMPIKALRAPRPEYVLTRNISCCKDRFAANRVL
jgi:hypothetical protein